MKYNKLVRDLIPDRLKRKNISFKAHTASDDEYKEALVAKLQEEVDEFISSLNPEELADILEVVYALAGLQGVNREGLEIIRQTKAKDRGSFKNMIILEEAD